jgi:hypothetical protein
MSTAEVNNPATGESWATYPISLGAGSTRQHLIQRPEVSTRVCWQEKGINFWEGTSPDKTLFRYAVSLAKLQIDFEHVDKLLSSQSSKRRRNIILQDLVDLVADRCCITIGVGGPL